jgi:hypothetical protein
MPRELLSFRLARKVLFIPEKSGTFFKGVCFEKLQKKMGK